jgi:hypothetical protein
MKFQWIKIATLTWVLPLDNSCPAGGANIGTFGLVHIHYWWTTGVAGKCLLWSSKGSSNMSARQRCQMMSCGGGSYALERRWHQMMMFGGRSNALAGRQTLKAAAEAKMAVAMGIILYSSSVILVGCVFA